MYPLSDRTSRLAAAGLALTVQFAHLWVLPGEFITWPLRGAFFAFVAMVYGVLAVQIAYGPGRWTIWFGVSFNVLVVSTWLFTRLIGVPSWTVFIAEPFGWPDAIATASEMLMIVFLIGLAIPRRSRLRAARRRSEVVHA